MNHAQEFDSSFFHLLVIIFRVEPKQRVVRSYKLVYTTDASDGWSIYHILIQYDIPICSNQAQRKYLHISFQIF